MPHSQRLELLQVLYRLSPHASHRHAGHAPFATASSGNATINIISLFDIVLPSYMAETITARQEARLLQPFLSLLHAFAPHSFTPHHGGDACHAGRHDALPRFAMPLTPRRKSAARFMPRVTARQKYRTTPGAIEPR